MFTCIVILHIDPLYILLYIITNYKKRSKTFLKHLYLLKVKPLTQGHYLGKEIVRNASRDSIDQGVSRVAQTTNVLDMKPVYVEVAHDVVRCSSLY